MKILLYPNAALSKKCEPVVGDDHDFLGQLEEMKKTLKAAGGLGLAANQVGILKRMFVAYKGAGIVSFINPRILAIFGERYQAREGCLSIPGFIETVNRYRGVMLEHQDETGTFIAEPIEGKLAHCIQHEMEHLDGQIFLKHLPNGTYDRWKAARKARMMRGVRR